MLANKQFTVHIWFKMVHVCLVWYIMAWISLYEGTSFITPYTMTWENAINNCTLGTPTISFEGRKHILPVQYNLTGKTGAWVGYYLGELVFHYLGCIEVEDIVKKTEFEYNTPGLCYSACNNSNVIGVSNFKCYCLNDTRTSKKSFKKCTSGCKGRRNFACGSNGYMSVYSSGPDATSYQGKGNCLQVEISNKTTSVSWSRCHRRKKVLCTNNNKQVLAKRNKVKTGRWRDATNKCFGKLTTPMSVKDLEILEGTANLRPSWTRVMKSDAIFSNDADKTSRNVGYLEKTKADTVLKFDKKGTTKRHILCKHDPSTTTKAKPTFEITSNKVKLMTSIKQAPRSTETSDTIKTTKPKTTFEITSNEVKLMTSTKQAPITTKALVQDIGIPVGISVVNLITLVTVGIGVVLFKRRRTMARRSARKHFSDKSTNCTQNSFEDKAYEISSEVIYDNVDDNVSLTNRATSSDSLDVGDLIAHNCLVTEINSKDCNTMSVVKDLKTDIGEDNEYDVVNYSIKTGNIFDDTYDTSETVAMKLKDKHNTVDDKVIQK